MVKHSYKIGNGVSDVEFVVSQLDTLDDITSKAIEFASATAQYRTLDVVEDYPLFLCDSMHEKQTQIGFIRITMTEAEYLVEHLTLSKEVINSRWNVTDFYAGKYGLTDKNK